MSEKQQVATETFKQTQIMLESLKVYYNEMGEITPEMWEDFEYFIAKLKRSLKIDKVLLGSVKQ